MDLKTQLEQSKKDKSKRLALIKKLLIMFALIFPLTVFGYVEVYTAKIAVDRVEKEIQQINQYLLAAETNNQVYMKKLAQNRIPVDKTELDQIQSKLIEKMRSENLNLDTIHTVNNNTKSKASAGEAGPAPGAEYEIKFTGSWADSMRFIRYLQNGDVFLNVTAFKMDTISRSTSVVTTLKYKVFTE
ncbi:hypothetical protein [Sporomusa sphaeroides]|uniref:Pilus assembly protein, PilO n=1 Tax=Sporomusa sphaeroides DSM 2875 TaxID=1337886 RepID=A0A1U7M9U2_9FIRM|nr:hypothetical protein [Sporomusa sphaeroides]OLS54294.1 hypothetical protein SPSPH_45400 [Sporomusa sphaeroides DSM 2875]CVK21674.1 hypothetical protein SSPH_04369 [Sporomusa sphaeroides DSM 2875]